MARQFVKASPSVFLTTGSEMRSRFEQFLKQPSDFREPHSLQNTIVQIFSTLNNPTALEYHVLDAGSPGSLGI